MPQAIVDPEELARFASNLRQFNVQLQEGMLKLNGQFDQLSSTWRDQEHQKFAQEYEQTMKVLTHFLQVSDQHIPFLLRKAQRVREYLSQ
ncbi:hypothetical protein U27_06585 [Candidatus Vecturithrix granuli]|uniref:WXG100 family type VII secretion target n=1 Tax=Vecturithrix granuli TaxID=1499967 RepID=A0A081C4U5_VECG1|nr:hypothetical protein U27_06585 [Candidatus Vecturithrix granuli]